MKTIYKYSVHQMAHTEMEVMMPAGAAPIRFALQGENRTLWAIVDPDAEPTARRFIILGTGSPIPTGATYIGSIQPGPFVWHLFELPS